MKKSFVFFTLVILLCFTFSCQQGEEVVEGAKQAVNAEADVEAIEALLDTYTTTIAAGDLDGWITIMAEDGVAMPPNEETVKGKKAIRQWAQPWFDLFNVEESILIDEIEVSGDWAFARLTTEFKGIPKEGGETIQGKNKALWIFKRKADSSWKCSHSIWNSNDPISTSPEQEL